MTSEVGKQGANDVTESVPARLRVAVVGAGVSGLVCAKELVSATDHANESYSIEVHLFERDSASRIGGRVTTNRHPDGFLLDRGFQILIASYPEVRRQLDLEALGLKSFEQGAVVVTDSLDGTGVDRHIFANPLTSPWYLLKTLRLAAFRWGSLSTAADVFRLVRRVILPGWLGPGLSFGAYLSEPYKALRERWGLPVYRSSAEVPLNRYESELSKSETLEGADLRQGLKPTPQTTMDFLANHVCLSSGFFDEFLQPFFEAIYVSSLELQHPAMFEFVLRMLAVPGSAALPRDGIQAIPEQLLQKIQSAAVPTTQGKRKVFLFRPDTEVTQVEETDSAPGEGPKAKLSYRSKDSTVGGSVSFETYDAVVIATEWPAALKLTSNYGPKAKMGQLHREVQATASETWYFCLPEEDLPLRDKLIILNATGRRSRSDSKNLKRVAADAGGGSLHAPLVSTDTGEGAAPALYPEFRVCNIGFPSTVQRSYAPPGFHLCAVTVMRATQGLNLAVKGVPCQWPDESWVRRQVEKLLDVKRSSLAKWNLLERSNVEFHQPIQAPQVLDALLRSRDMDSASSILFCGDWRSTPTLDGAMLSGRINAERVLKTHTRSTR